MADGGRKYPVQRRPPARCAVIVRKKSGQPCGALEIAWNGVGMAVPNPRGQSAPSRRWSLSEFVTHHTELTEVGAVQVGSSTRMAGLPVRVHGLADSCSKAPSDRGGANASSGRWSIGIRCLGNRRASSPTGRGSNGRHSLLDIGRRRVNAFYV